jgi:hypothetical protein
MKFDGTAWANVGTTGLSIAAASYISMATNGIGTPYVAYRDAGNGNKASAMKFDGTAWSPVGAATGFSGAGAAYTSLAFNGSGTPYVAYQDASTTPTNKATVMKFDGTNWVTVGGAGFSGAAAVYTSLAVNNSGTPYVAYQDASTTPINKATVMKFDGTNWVPVGGAGFSGAAAAYTSLAFNSSGTPYVAYQDASSTPANKVTVMKFDGTAWVTVGTAGFSAGAATYVSLAVDGSGTPYVAYQDGAAKVTIMKFDGTAWPLWAQPVFQQEPLPTFFWRWTPAERLMSRIEMRAMEIKPRS